MALKRCHCGFFLPDLVIMAELQLLFEGHFVILSYVWHLASGQQALHCKRYNAPSQSLSFIYRNNATEQVNYVWWYYDRAATHHVCKIL